MGAPLIKYEPEFYPTHPIFCGSGPGKMGGGTINDHAVDRVECLVKRSEWVGVGGLGWKTPQIVSNS